MTSLLLTAAEERARELLDERRHLTMSNAAFRALTESLDEPGQPVPQLVELFDLPPLAQQ